MKPLRSCRWATLLCLLAVAWGGGIASADEPSGTVEETFAYPLRPGESLPVVARIFRVPAEELARRNGIEDTTRLQVGQVIQVPNGFAREAAELRAERDRLRRDGAGAGRELAERDGRIADLETRLAALASEKAALAAALAATEDWRQRALALAALLALAVLWAVKSRFDRARFAWKNRTLVTENAALAEAKDTYRRVAAQVELRYQRLYGGRQEFASEFISEGIERIRRAYKDGSREIESLLRTLEAERELRAHPLARLRAAAARLFHVPARELPAAEAQDHAS